MLNLFFQISYLVGQLVECLGLLVECLGLLGNFLN